MTNVTKAARVLALAATLLAAPALVDKPAEALGLDVRPTVACAQATECTFSLFKVCSTHHDDVWFYRCSKGCGPPPAEEEA